MSENETTHLSDAKNNHNDAAPTEKLVGVRFQVAGKPYHFAALVSIEIALGDWVVVETVYGEQVGQVSYVTPQFPKEINPKKLKRVRRLANGLDMVRHQLMQKRAERIIEVTKEETSAAKIELKPISAEFTLDGNSAIVLGTGNASKKDMTNLRRRLSSRMNCRVELRTVGPRDHAKSLDGYGVCGEPRCCGRFLTEFQAVSIRMAKDQAISMAPTDITGMCGRLRCCLAYEHKVYKDASADLPRVKSRVRTEKGLGRVVDLDILKAEVIVEIPPDGPRHERERFRFLATEVEVVPRKQN